MKLRQDGSLLFAQQNPGLPLHRILDFAEAVKQQAQDDLATLEVQSFKKENGTYAKDGGEGVGCFFCAAVKIGEYLNTRIAGWDV